MKAFVFSGMALLLAIPAIILAASLLHMMSMADTSTTLSIASDKVFYAARDLDSSIRRAACNFIYLNTEDGKVNATAVRDNLTDIWLPFVENNYSRAMGLIIDVYDGFDVYYDPSNRIVIINTSAGGIPVNISTPDEDIRYSFSLGPYYLPQSCGNPLETECNPIALIVNFVNISSGASFCYYGGACPTPVNIDVTVVDNCNTPRVNGDATVVVKVINSTDDIVETITLSDADGDGVYSGTWYPNYSDIFTLSANASDIYGAEGGGSVDNIEVIDCGTTNSPPDVSNLEPGDVVTCGGGVQEISFDITDNDLDTVDWAIVYDTDPNFSSPSYINGSVDVAECGVVYNVSANLTYTSTTYYYVLASDGKNVTRFPAAPIWYYTITVSTEETSVGTVYYNSTQDTIAVHAPYSGDCDADNYAKASILPGSGGVCGSTKYDMTDLGDEFTYTFSNLSCGSNYTVCTEFYDPDNGLIQPFATVTDIVSTQACPSCSTEESNVFPDQTWTEDQKGNIDDKTDRNNELSDCNDKNDGMEAKEKWKNGAREWKKTFGKWRKQSINNLACYAQLVVRYRMKKNDPGGPVTLVIRFSGGANYTEEKVVTDDTSWTTYTTPWFEIDGTKDTYVTFELKEHADNTWGNNDEKKVEIDCFRINYKHW